ncbi:hypothetical protein, partial [Thiolapillus sp.]|uniref:hypothetical protein n=1 Tax=Thiolapillus sp. TaxID=2017437 RepID=UPI003AF4FA12
MLLIVLFYQVMADGVTGDHCRHWLQHPSLAASHLSRCSFTNLFQSNVIDGQRTLFTCTTAGGFAEA